MPQTLLPPQLLITPTPLFRAPNDLSHQWLPATLAKADHFNVTWLRQVTSLEQSRPFPYQTHLHTCGLVAIEREGLVL